MTDKRPTTTDKPTTDERPPTTDQRQSTSPISLLYQPMPKVTRRAALKALAATGVGAIAGTGAYGFLYARHQLTLTQLALPFRGLPHALDGLRLGLLTDVH